MANKHSGDRPHGASMPGGESAVPSPPLDLPNALTYADFEDYRHEQVLSDYGLEATEAALLNAVANGPSPLRMAAAHTLGRIGTTSSIENLPAYFDDADELVALEAGYASERLQPSTGLSSIRRHLDTPTSVSLVAPIAAGYLARLGDPTGFPVVVGGLNSDLLVVRMAACKQLYFFVPFDGTYQPNGTRLDVFASFQTALVDPATDVRWQAVVQLRELRSARARDFLADVAATDPSTELRAAAAMAIAQLRGEA